MPYLQTAQANQHDRSNLSIATMLALRRKLERAELIIGAQKNCV
jgi:hypothetical protein